MEKTKQLPTIPLSRDSSVDAFDLELMHSVLSGNEIAIKYLPDMLRYANELLANAERHCRTPYDLPVAQVAYGNATFLFSRPTQTISAAAIELLRPEWEAMQTFIRETDARLGRSQDG